MTKHILPIKYREAHWSVRREVRNQYVEEQKGLCHHCKAPLSGPPHKDVLKLSVNATLFPDNFFKYPVHLHHCHKTDYTIGAVHNHCNAVLWEYHGE